MRDSKIEVGDIVYCHNGGSGALTGEYYEVQELTETFGARFLIAKPVNKTGRAKRIEAYRTRFRACTETELSKLAKKAEPERARTRMEDLIL